MLLFSCLRKKVVDINKRDKNGYSLMDMAISSDTLLMDCLINNGFKINDANGSNHTSLGYACQRGDLKKASYLLSNGAFPDTQNKIGLTPIMICSVRDDIDGAMLLLEYNADTTKTCYFGTSALEYAFKYGSVNVAILLYMQNPGQNIRFLPVHREIILAEQIEFYSKTKQRVKMYKFFIEKGLIIPHTAKSKYNELNVVFEKSRSMHNLFIVCFSKSCIFSNIPFELIRELKKYF